MVYNLQNEYDVPKFKEYINKLYQERAVVEVKKRSTNRTISQNSYLHMLCAYFGFEYGCSAAEAKVDFYKRTCNRDLYEREHTNRVGKVVKYLRSSTELTVDEMTLSIQRFKNWAASEAGIYLPDAANKDMLIYIQQQIERNKLFL